MKNKSTAIILAALSLLSFGLPFHKIYLDRPGDVLLRVLLWPFGSWLIALFDLVLLLCISKKGFDSVYNSEASQVQDIQVF